MGPNGATVDAGGQDLPAVQVRSRSCESGSGDGGLAEVAETGIDLIALNPVYDMERQAQRLAACE